MMMVKHKGFSFLELLAATTILTVALIPIVRTMAESMRLATKVEQSTKCGFLAQYKMDVLRYYILKPKYLFPSYVSGYDDSYTETTTSFGPPFAKFKYTVGDSYASGNYIRTLQVTVWYDDDSDNSRDTGEESVILYTKIAKRD